MVLFVSVMFFSYWAIISLTAFGVSVPVVFWTFFNDLAVLVSIFEDNLISLFMTSNASIGTFLPSDVTSIGSVNFPTALIPPTTKAFVPSCPHHSFEPNFGASLSPRTDGSDVKRVASVPTLANGLVAACVNFWEYVGDFPANAVEYP